MFSRMGNVVARNQSGIWLEFKKDCVGCRRCSPTDLVRLPSEVTSPGQPTGNQVELSISLGSQCWLLLNSLLWPLTGFVVAAAVSHQLNLSEPIAVLMSLAGFLGGMGLCRKFSERRLKIVEI